MPPASSPNAALYAAVLRLLRPICRLLLRHQVSFASFAELAKHAYVQVALEEFAIPGRKPTQSRASILTGLTRKEVQRVVSEPAPRAAATEENYNRAARVLTGWARDSDFRDAAGAPRALTLQDGPATFGELVRRYSGDMPARAVLDELLRVGAVTQGDDGAVVLVQKAYIPQRGEVEKLGILGSDVADLVTTIDHNLQHGADDPRFQRKVMYRRMPAEVRPAFRALSARLAQGLLERLDAWLAERGAADTPEVGPQAPRVRIGLGIYYFEAPSSPD